MAQFFRIFTLALSFLITAISGYSQDGGNRPNRPQGNRPDVNSAEWRQQQGEIIVRQTQEFMQKMGDAVPEEKKAEVAKIVQDHLVAKLKLRIAIEQAREKAAGNREQMRNIMTANQEKLKGLVADANKQAGKVLDKKALGIFKKNMEVLSPPQGGPGAGGRGGRGGGQGGGGGGGGGGGR